MADERDFEELHDAAEREAEDMQRRGEQVDERIEKARADWEAKKADESIPGARPEDEAQQRPRADEDGPPPEADYVTPGD
jgi:hypothetical protein